MTKSIKDAYKPVIYYLMLTTCLGDEIDLFPQMLSMAINEDMFFPCLTGTLVISDSLGLLEKLSFSGNETLTVRFKSWDYSDDNNPIDFFHRTFDILKITDIKQANDYTKTYTLHFASPELKKNETIKISKSYFNSSLSQVVADVMTGDYNPDNENPRGLSFPIQELPLPPAPWVRSPFLQRNEIEVEYQDITEENAVELFVEKTKYEEPVITIPYSKPFDIISWCTSRAIRLSAGKFGNQMSGQSANYVFFENKRGYQFTSIDSLIENSYDIKTEFVFGNAAQNLQTQRSVMRETVEKLQIVNSFDVIRNIQNGTYSSQLTSYDILTGELRENNYNYSEDFYNTISLERTQEQMDYPMVFLDRNNQSDLTNKYLSRQMFVVQTPTFGIDNYTNGETQRINHVQELVSSEEYLQKRLSQLGRLNNFKVLVEIAGNSKHKVGDVINLVLKELPIQSANINKVYPQLLKYYSGNYLITNIIHSVSPVEYKMIIELTKDSFKQKIGEL